jgi:hypothetical protein
LATTTTTANPTLDAEHASPTTLSNVLLSQRESKRDRVVVLGSGWAGFQLVRVCASICEHVVRPPSTWLYMDLG